MNTINIELPAGMKVRVKYKRQQPKAVGSSELLSCPFCGRPAQLKEQNERFGVPKIEYRVGCTPCFVWFQRATKPAAIKAWNNRAG